MKSYLYSGVTLILSVILSQGYRHYQQRILNGDLVPNPCCPGNQRRNMWAQVGHALRISNLNAFGKRILNGDLVPNPCCPGNQTRNIWQQVGHSLTIPNLNAFGDSFRNHGRRFTYGLCMEDSDGDGISNGEELGMTPRGSYNLTWLCRVYDQYSDDQRLLPALQRNGLIRNPRGHPGFCDIGQGCRDQQNYLQCHTQYC